MRVDTQLANQNTVQYRVNQSARKILRYGALAAPFSMMAFNLALFFNIIPIETNSVMKDPLPVVILGIAWMMLGIFTFSTQQSRKVSLVTLEVSSYYALAMIQTWIVSGMNSPFSGYWVMLLVATYVLLSKVHLLFGIIAYLIHAAISTVMIGLDSSLLVTNLAVTSTAVAASLVVIVIYSSQKTNYQDVMASHIREETERNQTLTLINNLTDSVFGTNNNGFVTTFNSAALNLLDTNDAIEGKYISDLIKLENEKGETIDVFDELSKSKTIRKCDDLIMRIDDNDLMRLEVTFAPVQGGEDSSNRPETYVLILRDITRMKSLEEERDEFISVVSHELRTPVAITEGSLSNAGLLAEREGNEKIAENINNAHAQVVYLAKMVNNLSTLSRAERGLDDQLELIDPGDLAQTLYNHYLPEAETAGLQLNLDIVGKPGGILTSRLYLQELLQNFITNAIKYTKKGSVTIHVAQNDKAVQFSVSDTGIGIGKSDLKRIFSRFYRAEDYRTRETNGTGLGLYVAAKLAKKIGTEIAAESRLNHGSKFSFELPVL